MACQKFMTRTRLVLGSGAIDQIGSTARGLGKKVLIVTDDGVKAAGLTEIVQGRLQSNGLDVAVFSDVEGNPTVENVVAGLAAQREARADLLVAVGGGSAIDAAKAIAVVATGGGAIRDYEGFERLKAPPMPLLAVPTTVGTGSETTKGAVISDHAAHHKIIVVSDLMYPQESYLDPCMVEGLPPHITAWTGIDALTHAIEGYVAKGANPFSDVFNMEAIQRVGRSPRSAVQGDASALHDMQIAAALAGVGFHNAGLGLAHALANTIGGHFPTHHGATNGVLLPHVMRFNLSAASVRFAAIAVGLGVDVRTLSGKAAAEAAVDAVEALIRDIGAPATLRSLEIPEDMLPTIARLAIDQIDRPANPRENGIADMEAILRAAF